MKSRTVLALIGLALCGTLWAQQSAVPAPAKKSPAPRPEMLVSTQWLADHLSDPSLVLVHVGGSPSDYHAQHIPGARHLPTEKFVDSKPPGTELLAPEQLKKNLEEIGISDDSRVVFYADWDPHGHQAVLYARLPWPRGTRRLAGRRHGTVGGGKAAGFN